MAAGPAEEFRRFERKFVVGPARTDLLASWLRHTCRPAPDFAVGRVTSCYYDNVDWDSYFESADGEFAKRKVRLRWYDNLPGEGTITAYLETKEKEGFETWKRRVPLGVEASLLAGGRFEQALPRALLVSALASLGVFDPGDLRPAVVISYRRQRFHEPFSGLHLALDSGIEAAPAGELSDWPGTRLPATVLEVKGRVLELPPSLRGLPRLVPTWSAHSKYALAVEALADRSGPFRV